MVSRDSFKVFQKPETRDPRDSCKLLQKQDKGSPRFFQITSSKTKQKWSSRFLQNYFKNPRFFQTTSKTKQKPPKGSPKFFQTSSKTR